MKIKINSCSIVITSTLLILFLILISSVASASAVQNSPSIEWQKCFGGSGTDRAHSIQQTSDGGYIVAGESKSNDGNVTGNHGNTDCWIVKLDANGNIVWEKCLGGSSLEWASVIQQTSDGGYIVAMISDSNDGNVTGNHGLRDSWVVKLDTNGNMVWQKCLGGLDYDLTYSIQQTSDGSYIVVGFSGSNVDITGKYGDTDCWIVKLDANGNIVWQKCLGGSSYDYANSIQQTSDGGYIIAGESESNDGNVTGNHGNTDYWIVKLDANGNIVWQKCFGGSGIDKPSSIQQTSDGGYIVAGESDSNDGNVTGNHGNTDCWIIKLDENGNIIWQKCLGDLGYEGAYSIRQTSDGSYIIAGNSQPAGDIPENYRSVDYWIVKLDANGNIVWQKCLGGSSYDYANSIQQTSDGGYIIAGESESNDGNVTGNHGNTDCWIVKLDANGNIVWEKCLGGSSFEWVSAIQQTSDGGYIVAGGSDSNDGNITGNHGDSDYWVVKLASQIPIADFSATPTSGSSPLNVSFIDSSKGNPTSWLWDFGDGTNSTEQVPMHLYSNAGNYTITLTANNSAGSNTVTKYSYITVVKTDENIIEGLSPLSIQFIDYIWSKIICNGK